MKSLKFSILFFLVLGINTVNAQLLSEKSEISLITCNPGEELYSVFGHSAIRVRDIEKGIDWVYNYGTFNFNEPNFYTKFVRGYLNYKLSVYNMRDFLAEYQYENRSVFEQVLDLSQEEKNKVFKFLEFNRRPENKYYLYDFFFDNCATRIRDVFQNELKENIQFSTEQYTAITFRQMLEPYLKNHPWSGFGINLVLGAIADRKSNLDESMFLPDYMKTAFDNSSLNYSMQTKKLVKSSAILFEQAQVEKSSFFITSPVFVFWFLFLFILYVIYREISNKVVYKFVDFSVFLFIGTIGLILFLMWTATNHTAVVKNWNLMWAIPTHFIFAFLVFRKAKSFFLKYYFLVTGIVTFSVIPLWPFIPQQFDTAFIPLILTSAARSFQLYRYYK